MSTPVFPHHCEECQIKDRRIERLEADLAYHKEGWRQEQQEAQRAAREIRESAHVEW